MKKSEIEKQIFNEAKTLPKEILQEVLDYIFLIKRKYYKSKHKQASNIKDELVELNNKEISHLEEEFKNYKKLYPREK